MLRLDNININYGKKRVISEISLTADYGQIIGLLGLNGSGKSSLLTVIAGLKKPLSGSISLDDISSTDGSYKKHFGYVTQETALRQLSNPPLSVLKVHEFINVPVRSMSGGMKKRLQLATVLIQNPRVLLLDEPLSALDIPAKEDIISYIWAFRNNGGLVICASHDDAVFRISDKIMFIDRGKLVSLAPGTDYHSLLRGRIYE